MRPCLVTILLGGGCLLAAGCVTTGATTRPLAGSFRYGLDPNNAEYLTLERDGSFGYSEVSTEAVGQTVLPHVEAQASGRWRVEGQEVVLNALVTQGRGHHVHRYRISGRGSARVLSPVYGAGYVAASGFVRISAAESARYSRLDSAPTGFRLPIP